MIAYSKKPRLDAYNSLMSTFSRIYNILDHPSKNNYASKYSRHTFFVTGTACNNGNMDADNDNDKEARTGQYKLMLSECVSRDHA